MCGESTYAVPAESASEVVSVPALTRVPGAPPHLLGVFAHRGEVIPVVDVGLWLGSGAEPNLKRAVLVRVPRGVFALTASRVAGVAELVGELNPLATAGPRAHLKGPAKALGVEVVAVEPQGMFELLSKPT